MGNTTFNRVEITPGAAPASLTQEDGVPVLGMSVPGLPAAITYWRMSFDFEPKRSLTPAEREQFEDVVVAAARAFLDAMPEEPQG